ncbi:MAG: hypothetical protein IAC13_05875 [Firmicutes bacterium]|uniref:Uncharacterized protein n=1 Tax=Candidatus Scybalomonas excrementavium TaxID=2840943 RepID=A0A9D9N7V1_9FIRM|nr:hypothetical protein [Candidatus Scybalomonas excrementavium]
MKQQSGHSQEMKREHTILTKVIGFIGTDKYDFISCIAKVLSEMQMKVLLVDYTTMRSLMSTIPDYIQGQTMEYQNIFYLGDPKIGEIQNLIQQKEYDFILMDFDYSCGRRDVFLCENIVFFTDLQRHHMEALEGMKLPSSMNKYMVFRMELLNKTASTYLRQVIQSMGILKDHAFYLKWGTKEKQNQIRCQYQFEIPWKRTASSMRKIVWSLVKEWVMKPNEEKEISVVFGS